MAEDWGIFGVGYDTDESRVAGAVLFSVMSGESSPFEKSGVDFKYFELPHSGHGLQNDNAISKQWMEAVEGYLKKYIPVD